MYMFEEFTSRLYSTNRHQHHQNSCSNSKLSWEIGYVAFWKHVRIPKSCSNSRHVRNLEACWGHDDSAAPLRDRKSSSDSKAAAAAQFEVTGC